MLPALRARNRWCAPTARRAAGKGLAKLSAAAKAWIFISQSANRQTALGPASRMRLLPRGEEGLRGLRSSDEPGCGQLRSKLRGLRLRRRGGSSRTRPAWSWLAVGVASSRTAAAVVLIVGVLLHAMFGANGMVVYRQKRTEMQALQNDVERLQKKMVCTSTRSRRSRPTLRAIEKESARAAALHSSGEVILVSPALRKSRPPAAPGIASSWFKRRSRARRLPL